MNASRRGREIPISQAENISSDGLKWYGLGDEVKVGPFLLKGPLVYTALGGSSKEGSAILVSKKVLSPQESVKPVYFSFGYFQSYPDYGIMKPTERWSYLRWLHDGRMDTKDQGHMLLFLEGLERRALLDGKDHEVIWQEIWRLKALRKYTHSIFHYASEQLLWFLIGKAPDIVPLEHLQFLSQRLTPVSYWEADAGKRLSLLVWWCTRRFGGLPAWMAYQCARVSMDSRNTVVLSRADEEMKQLFHLRFQETWGELIPLTLPPKARSRMSYQAGNSSLGRYTCTWPDPLKMYASWGKIEDDLVRIYNGCQEELRPLALFLGKDTNSRKSIAAWELLPSELRSKEHPALEAVKALGGEVLEETGRAWVCIGEIAEILEIPLRESLSVAVAGKLAGSLQGMGFGLEPDARLSGKAIKWYDSVALFRFASKPKHVGFSAAEVSRYQTSAYVLKLAFYVAQSGGAVSEGVALLIETRLAEILKWNAQEGSRFQILARLFAKLKLEKTGVRAPTNIRKFNAEAVGELLLQLVAQDNRIGQPQEEALRWAWKRLDLEARKLKVELDGLSSKGVIFFGEMGVPGRGEKIPPPPVPPGSEVAFELDREVLSTLLADTHHVQSTLNAAMATDEVEPVEEVSAAEVPVEEAEEVFPGLSRRFVSLLEALLERDEWAEAEAGDLARQHGVMLSGAIEAINDWAFESLGSQLVWEDGPDLTVERALLK